MKTFKNIVLFLGTILLCSLALVSCQKDSSGVSSQVKQKGDKLYWFIPSFEEGVTKAYVDMANSGTQDACTVRWQNGDQVFVLNGHDALKFKYNSTKKMFVSEGGPDTATPGMGITWKEDCGYVVVYPASIFKSQSYSGSGTNLTVNISLPSKQNFTSGRARNAPMMATITAAQMENPYKAKVSFRNLCGVLGFSITGDDDKQNYSSVSFTGVGACGTGSFVASPTAAPALAMNTTTKTVTMTFDLAQDEDTQSYYYMYLPPATYTTPTVAVNFAGGSTVDRTATNLLIERSKYAVAADYFQTLFSGGGELGAHTGTAANPYLIRNGNDLVELAAKVNSTDAAYSSATSALSAKGEGHHPDASPSKSGQTYNTEGVYFKLVADIDMTDFNSRFAPIGSDESTHAFKGNFDGNGHTISNLSLSGTTNQGLFGILSGATISNLTLSNPTVSGSNFVGALAGKSLNSTIKGVTVTDGSVSGSGNTIGGIVGLLSGGTIGSGGDCSSTCAVSGASYVGGVVGAASAGTIYKCTHTIGAVTGSNIHIGGVVGSLCSYSSGTTSYGTSTATINACNSNCAVSNTRTDNANCYTGGVIGSTNAGSVINCKATGGTVTAAGGNIVGGVIGEINGGATVRGSSDSSRASNKATVSGYNYVGGICGKVWYGTLKWYNNNGGTVTGNSYVGGVTGGTGSGGECTVTYCNNSRTINGLNRLGGCVGEFGLSTACTGSIDNCINSGTVVTTNTDAATVVDMGGCIGRAQATGTVNACSNSHAITTSNAKGRCVAGIVGRVIGSTDVINCSNTKNIASTGYYVGGIVGQVNCAAGGVGIRSCSVTGCTISSTATDYGVVGGIVGDYYSPTEVSGDVTDVIYNCEVKGITVSATSAAGQYGACGGIAGRIKRGSRIISCCSRQSKITAQTACGGIVGRVQVVATDSGPSVLIRNSLSQDNWLYGSSTARKNMLGGIVGWAYQDSGSDYVRITQCISDCNCYESKYTAVWGSCSGGFVGYMSGAGANVGIRNSFSNHYHTTSKNPKGGDYNCFLLPSASRVGSGGFVGYFDSSQTTTELNIYNCGSRMSYGAWNLNGTTFDSPFTEYYDNWQSYGINPITGHVGSGVVRMRVVFWCTPIAPYTYDSFNSGSVMEDLRSDDSTGSFDLKGQKPYMTSTCINSSFMVTRTYYNANGTLEDLEVNPGDANLSQFWGQFYADSHPPVRSSRWGSTQYQAATLLSYTEGKNYGYPRDHAYVNEGMGYTSENWVSTNNRLTVDNRWYPGGVWWGSTPGYSDN